MIARHFNIGVIELIRAIAYNGLAGNEGEMDMETSVPLNLQIARLRREKGTTQEELARYLGVTYQAVSKWETSASYPDITMLPNIAEYFQTTVDAVLGCEAKPCVANEGLYPAVRGALEGLPPDRLYRAVWNLSCLLHEAAATGGWSRALPWEQRDRLGDNGYDNWGFSVNIEPQGYTMLVKGLTVIGLMEQLPAPAPSQCRRIAALCSRLSQENVLRVMQHVVSSQHGEDAYKTFTAAELAAGAELSGEDLQPVLDRLDEYGWLTAENGGYRLDNRLDAALLPLLGILKAACFHMNLR